MRYLHLMLAVTLAIFAGFVQAARADATADAATDTAANSSGSPDERDEAKAEKDKKQACTDAKAEAEKSGTQTAEKKADEACGVDYMLVGDPTKSSKPADADSSYPDETTKGMGATGSGAQYAADYKAGQEAVANGTANLSGNTSNGYNAGVLSANNPDLGVSVFDTGLPDTSSLEASGAYTPNPITNIGANTNTNSVNLNTALGADARDQAHYLPPANPKINGTEVSWAKLESFKQLAKEKGYSDNAIAAMAGNLQAESKAFNLNQWYYDEATGKNVLTTSYGALSQGDKTNGVYTSFGIAQYHNERATDMMNSVGASSLTPTGLQGTTNAQYEYLFNDISKQMSSSSYNTFTDPNVSLDTATQIFVSKYERPASSASDRYGLAGGTARYNYAVGAANAMNADVVADGSDWNASSHVTGKAVAGNNTSTPSGATINTAGLGVSAGSLATLATATSGITNSNWLNSYLTNLLGGSTSQNSSGGSTASQGGGTGTSLSSSGLYSYDQLVSGAASMSLNCGSKGTKTVESTTTTTGTDGTNSTVVTKSTSCADDKS